VRERAPAADSLQKRARAIHDRPIDEGTFARVITITTSVIAVTIARLILDPFGLLMHEPSREEGIGTRARAGHYVGATSDAHGLRSVAS
jgi:hypothetical protein